MNERITALGAVSTLQTTDLTVVVQNVSSTPVNKKATVQNFLNLFGSMAFESSNSVSITGGSITGVTGVLTAANNLSDLSSLSTAQTNIGAATALWNANKLQGTSINSAAPTDRQYLGYSLSGTNWVPLVIQGSDIQGGNPSFTSLSVGGGAFSINSSGTATLTGMASLFLQHDPTVSNEAATKAYVDSVAGAGLTVQTACQAATAGSDIGATYNNGTAGVGATLTNSGTQVAFAIDGYTASLNDRILVKDQTDPSQNGIYKVTTLGSVSTNWVLTRPTDYDLNTQIKPGNLIPVDNGTVNAVSSWLQTQTVTTIGTDPILFSQFTVSPNAFLKKTNNLSDLTSVSSAQANIGANSPAWNADYIQNTPVSATTPTINQILTFDGSNWTPTTQEGDNPFQFSNASTVAMVTNNRYATTRTTGVASYTLPAVSAKGDTIRLKGIGNTGGWYILQGAGQQITLNNLQTTSGATGFLSSNAPNDDVTLLCTVANLSWVAIDSSGNITVNIGAGTTNSWNSPGLFFDGQILIGKTGNGTIPIVGTLVGGTGISVNFDGSNFNIAATGTADTFVIVTSTSQAMSSNTRYRTNNATLVTMTLPTTSAAGDLICVSGMGVGRFVIAQNAGQQILGDAGNTTLGVTGSLLATSQYASVWLECIVANLTWAYSGGTYGNFTAS